MRTRFMGVVVGMADQYKKALEIAKANGTDLTIYSATEKVVSDLAKGVNVELIEKIKRANNTQTNIEELEEPKEKTDEMTAFFEAFDNTSTKERLFLIIGESGVGKTYSLQKRYPEIFSIPCNKGMDAFSFMYTLDLQTKQYVPTEFHKAIIEGRKVWLDEINELPNETLMLLQGITDEKEKINWGTTNIDIHPDFRIIGTMNPPSETDERTPLGDALLGRAVGVVLELTDEIISERIGVSQRWINAVRRLYSYIQQSGMIDVRDLTFRDYQRFAKYNFETQLKFKVCMGDISNIRMYKTLETTGEFKNLVREVKNNEPKTNN